MNLKVHLAADEIRTEWQTIEDKKWPEVEHKLRKLAENYEEHVEELAGSAKVVGEEIRHAYDRIKTRLNEED